MKSLNIFRGITLIFAVACFANPANSQEINLVPNGGFEDTNISKLRSYGQMEEFKDYQSHIISILESLSISTIYLQMQGSKL
jgi:hypothetical protein